MGFTAVITVVRTDLTDRVVKAAKGAGATGATIIPAHGTGIHEAKTFFGLSLAPPRDVILMVMDDDLVEPVSTAITTAGEFSQPGTGIALVVEVKKVLGMESQIAKTLGDILN